MSNRRKGNPVLRLIGKILSRAAIVLIVLVMLPYAQKWASRLLSNMTDQAANTTVILTEKLSGASRLETTHIYNESVLDSKVDAFLIGTVQHVQIHYVYEASIGIDLSRVEVRRDGDTVVITLPKPELLTDSLTPTSIERDDFWYTLTDARLQKLLNEEKEKLRSSYLSETDYGGIYWQDTIYAFENTVAAWINLDGGLTFVYEQEASE